MNEDVARQIGVYLDEIQDLARAVEPAKLKEIRARVEVIKHAIGVTTMVQDPDTGTGQQLKDLLPEWDKPSDQVAAEKGITVLMVEAVKRGLESKGLQLQHPSDPQYNPTGWHNVGDQGIPADWEERIRKGEPLT